MDTRSGGCKSAPDCVLSRPNSLRLFGLPASLPCLTLARQKRATIVRRGTRPPRAAGTSAHPLRQERHHDALHVLGAAGHDRRRTHAGRQGRKPYWLRIGSGSSVIVMKLTVSTAAGDSGTGGSSTISAGAVARPVGHEQAAAASIAAVAPKSASIAGMSRCAGRTGGRPPCSRPTGPPARLGQVPTYMS